MSFLNKKRERKSDPYIITIGKIHSENSTDYYYISDSLHPGSNKIKISAGSNTMLTVSQGYSNRLVTPFVHPEVVSTSLTGMSENGECGELCIKD